MVRRVKSVERHPVFAIFVPFRRKKPTKRSDYDKKRGGNALF